MNQITFSPLVKECNSCFRSFDQGILTDIKRINCYNFYLISLIISDRLPSVIFWCKVSYLGKSFYCFLCILYILNISFFSSKVLCPNIFPFRNFVIAIEYIIVFYLDVGAFVQSKH